MERREATATQTHRIAHSRPEPEDYRTREGAYSFKPTYSIETVLCVVNSFVVAAHGLDEHRAKLSAAMKGKKGRPVSLQTRAKISAALKGKKRKPRAS